jgi:plasmid maintenance system antidote protein VapI
VPSGRVTEALKGRRSITAEVGLRHGRYGGNSPQFWLELQCHYDIPVVEGERSEEIAQRVKLADAA